MKTSIRRRAAAVLATTIVAGGAMTAGAGPAFAADPTVRFAASNQQSDGSRSVVVYVDGRLAGTAYWTANGDKLQAVDPTPDGYGISAYLGTNPVREATTRGHNAPYTATTTGDLPEGRSYTFWVCVGKGGWQRCSPIYSVKS